MSHKEFCMICCRSSQCDVKYPLPVHCMATGDTWAFLCSVDVSVDLWGPALRPHSAWHTHSFTIFRYTPQLLSLSFSQRLSLYQDPNTPPQSYLCIVYDPQNIFVLLFLEPQFFYCPPPVSPLSHFPTWLSREISWLVLAGLKLVLAGLYWQYDWTMSSN